MPNAERRMSEITADYFREKFGVLTVAGGIYGFYTSRGWTIASYSTYVIMYFSVSLVVVDLLYTSWLLFDNMAMFSLAFHVFLVGCVVTTASFSTTVQRKKITALMWRVIFNEMAEYQSGPYYQHLMQLTDQRISKTMKFFMISYGTCGLVAVTVPFVDSYLGYDEDVSNVPGVYWKNLPFAMWFPFDAHNSTLAWFSFFFCQGIFAFFAPNMCTAAIMMCFLMCEMLLNHVKLLIHAVEHLDQRANTMFRKRYSRKPSGKYEEEYELCYYDCIVQNVQHHCRIKEQLSSFLGIANYAIAVPFFGGAMLLGLAGFNLISHEDPRIGPKCLIFSLAMTEAANMLMLCIYGERLQEESEKLFNSVLYTKWYKRSNRCRVAMRILQTGTFRTMKVSAAKLIHLNMDTFANLVNSAYSIFNLSTASMNVEKSETEVD